MPLTSILSPLAGRGEGALGSDFENVFLSAQPDQPGKAFAQRGNNVNVINNTAQRARVRLLGRGRLSPDKHARAAACVIRAKTRDSWC